MCTANRERAADNRELKTYDFGYRTIRITGMDCVCPCADAVIVNVYVPAGVRPPGPAGELLQPKTPISVSIAIGSANRTRRFPCSRLACASASNTSAKPAASHKLGISRGPFHGIGPRGAPQLQ